MRTFALILCGKYICRKTSLAVFMWQTKIVNYEYLLVYMTRHIFVACIYSENCQTKVARVNGALQYTTDNDLPV